MTGHFNGLTPAEAERLAVLTEEMGEVQRVIGKILRHGYENFDPTVPVKITNRQDLTNEIAHVHVAIDLLREAGDVEHGGLELAYNQKRDSIARWLRHQ